MAEIAKAGRPSLSTALPSFEHTLGGKVAGEDIASGDACYVKSDGTVWRANGAAANAAARYRGVAFTSASAGEAVTLVYGVRFRYGAGLTPGADVYLSGTVIGGLADAASTGGTTPIGYCVDDTRIEFFSPR